MLEVAAIGAPSEYREEEGKVNVILKDRATLSPEDLHEFCRGQAPAFMVPRYFEFVPALPKTPTQKMEKFRLRQEGITAFTWDCVWLMA